MCIIDLRTLHTGYLKWLKYLQKITYPENLGLRAARAGLLELGAGGGVGVYWWEGGSLCR